MNCQECQEQLTAYVEGLLDEPTRRDAEAHLQSCPGCRAECEKTRGLRARLTADAETTAQTSLAGPVMDAILRKQTSKLRRIAMLKKYTRAGLVPAAATIAAAVILCYAMLGGGASLSLAEVQAAVAEQSWVHVTYDTGPFVEQWVCLADGNTYCKRRDGDVVFADWARNLRYWYDQRARYISVDQPATCPGGQVPPWQPQTAWQHVVGPYEQLAGEPAPTAGVETEHDELDGKKTIRFDLYYKDATGKDILLTQLWADPKTRLPVRRRDRLQLAHRKQFKQEWATGLYDFPPKGPSSLYDLGVPRDVPVRKQLAPEHWAGEVRKVVEAAEQARQQFPRRYRAVVWRDQQRSEIDILYRDGVRIRQERYFSLDPAGEGGKAAQYSLAVPTTPEKILEWARGQVPVSIGLADGETEYSRRNSLPWHNRTTTVRVLKYRKRDLLAKGSRPEEIQWPLDRMGPPEILEHTPETPAGCIALRFEGGNSRSDYYVDPSHDYICVKQLQWRTRDGKWEKERESWLFDLRRLPGRQWYATRRLFIGYGDSTRNISSSKLFWNIDVEVLEDGQFPAGIFDGQRLLEGAKVESY